MCKNSLDGQENGITKMPFPLSLRYVDPTQGLVYNHLHTDTIRGESSLGSSKWSIHIKTSLQMEKQNDFITQYKYSINPSIDFFDKSQIAEHS